MDFLTNFIKELILRLFSDKPQFFKVLTWVSAGLALLAYILFTFVPAIGNSVPSWLSGALNYIIAFVSGILGTSALTVKSSVKAEKGIPD